ncbi:MAG: hypothetical protein IJC74_06640 [Clostridia bacterium]|nr:hypothetical protein [Clostridia bacterium]
MIDIHSHVLYGIDDGAGSIEESIEILKKSYEIGVKTMVATPHFYGENTSVTRFLEKRKRSYESIMEKALKENIKIPKIVLGAEVNINNHTAHIRNVERLCIGDTRYILLEMPYVMGGQWVFDHIFKIRSKYHLRPIIAHVERYMPVTFSGFGKISPLMDMDVAFQINADSLLKYGTSKCIKKLVKKGCTMCLGSDAHNTDSRPTRIAEAKKIICNKFGENLFYEMQENAELILHDDYL